MTQNKKIAITGGICCGKSVVADVLRKSGFRVCSCDDIYGNMLREGRFTDDLAAEFGDVILMDDGQVSRSELSKIVFRDEKKLRRLTELTNPVVIEEALERMNAESQDGYDEMVFSEVPMLFENGFEKYFDNVIVVIRDISDRLECVEARYGLDEAEALERISCQYDYEGKSFDGFEVLVNDGTMTDLQRKTEVILEKIIEKYKK